MLESDAYRVHRPASMPTSSRSPKQTPAEYRRVLTVLAASPNGCTEAIMLAHGFTLELLVDIIRAGLATAHDERMRAGSRAINVTRVKITEIGRQALTTLKRM
jgi:hypothetical protein